MGEHTKLFANKRVGRIDSHTYAFASRARDNSPGIVKKFTGIVVNNKWGNNAKKFIKTLESDVKLG